jgi:hypothetical protein
MPQPPRGATQEPEKELGLIRTAASGVALLLTLAGCNGPAVGLAPDLNFWVDCPRLSDDDQIKLENHLYAAGFDVLNRSRLARQLKEDYPPLVQIDAVDRRGFMFEISVLPFETDLRTAPAKIVSADAALYSPPPTRHDKKTEEAVLAMTTADLGCSPRQIERNENGAASGEMYRHVARLKRGWFAQAKAAAPQSNALHLH